MHPVTHQGNIIHHLNRYLDWHNKPVRMNRQGICNGLAAVYVNYALQGQTGKFQALLNSIANLSATSEWNEEIHLFAKKVAKSFMPEEYDKTLNQLQSITTLEIAGKPLTPSFELGMTTSDTHWIQILKDIALQDDEAMIIRSVNHAASLSKKEGQYILYDPNYSKGFKVFQSEKDVIHELHFNVFRYTGMLGLITDSFDLSEMLSPIAVPLELYGPLGLHVQVIRHPERNNTPRSFPDLGELFKKYFTTDQTALSSAGDHGITNLFWAILLDNKEAVKVLYDKGFNNDKHVVTACIVAASMNATQVLPLFLAQIKEEKDIRRMPDIFKEALREGRKEALETLLQDDNGSACFSDIILMRGNAATFLHHAAAGGNPDILKFMLDAYQNEGAPELSEKDIAQTILAGNAITAALGSKSPACVNLLYQQLKKVPGGVDEPLLLTHLLQAVRSNQLPMVQFFIEEIYKLPEHQDLVFEAITLTPSRVAQTDISILRLLQANRVHFSTAAQAIIDRKEKGEASGSPSIGDFLFHLTDFIKKTLLKRDEIQESISHFKTMKNGLFKMKPSEDPQEIELMPLNHDSGISP
ncbi:ankyrin repeat-containing protein [Legionella rubrilucens]|uniref:Ankyrin repeat-containing protein n=1 Tax=Legionella rubrilucens TaxID=458 RepID=A0A0W0XVU8_9GAMM|nr:YopT-type cysteine protease domain-containing protein [Legionella rubrilucens]KTD48757.1 ankyrin repeat-containing protein [Legionella rubrilucens]